MADAPGAPASFDTGLHSSYDLFVAYAEADRDWVHGYLLPGLDLQADRLLTKEDFRLGVPLVEEVERAVTASRFTVVVVTSSFLSDEWSSFGEQLASHAAATGSGPRVIPLILEAGEFPLRIEYLVRLDCTDPSRWEPEVDRLREMLDRPAPPPEALPCPYPGMVPFGADHERFFHGREDEVNDLLRRLRNERRLVVIGPSGSGKSSLVFAGVLPALARRHDIDWLVRSMRPGRSPLESLVEALRPAASAAPAEPVALATDLLATGPPTQRLLLLVDQLEEVFALAHAAERGPFFDAVLALRALDRCVLVFTVRADFYPELMMSPLWPLGAGERVDVAPLRGDALRRAIERPAAEVGVHLEPGLVQRLMADAADEPGVLPLLQETMVLLWEQRQRRLVTLASYDALGSDGRSGLEVALAAKADATLSSLTAAEQRVARRVFLRLVQLGEGRDDTRRQQSLTALRAAAEDPELFDATIGPLADHRLLTLSGGEHGSTVGVDIAHEALIAGWPTLRRWVDQDRAWLLVQEELAGDAREWDALGRDPGALYRGARLVTVAAQAAEHADEINALERAFLDTSLALASSEEERERRAHRRLRLLTGSLAVCLVLALVAATLAVDRTRTARAEARVADSRRLAAQTLTGLSQFDQALLTSVEAVRAADTVEARSALLTALQRSPRLVTFLRPGVAHVAGVAFSPDGTHVASGGASGSLLLWEVAGRRVAGTFRGATGAVSSVAFGPDGTTLATGADDGSVAVWDVAGRRLRRVPLAGHEQPVTSVAFSPDGRTLASAGLDKRIVLWDARTGESVGVLEGHTDWVSGIVFNADGTRLASSSFDRTVVLWDVPTRQRVTTLTGGDGMAAVALSGDGTRLAGAGHDGTVELWDVGSGQRVGQPFDHPAPVTSVAFTPDGATLASADDRGLVLLWNLGSAEPVPTALRGHRGAVTDLAFAPDGGTLISAGADGAVGLWRTEARHPLGRILPERPAHGASVAFSPDGAVLAAGNDDGTVELWNMAGGGRRTLAHVHGDAVTSVAFSPDGSLLATASDDSTVVVSDVRSGRRRGDPLHQGRAVFAVAFSSDGATLASGGRAGTVVLWDVRSRKSRATLKAGGVVTSVAFSPDGRSLFAATTSVRAASATVWDLSQPKPSGRPLSGTAGARSLAVTPDGSTLAVGDGSGVITLVDARTGRRLSLLTGHKERVRSLAFSPDGTTLASGSADDTVMLWDVATRQRIGSPFEDQPDDVISVAFSPDGATLASSSWDGTLVLRDLSVATWVERACRMANRNLTRAEWDQVMGTGRSYHRSCPALPEPAGQGG